MVTLMLGGLACGIPTGAPAVEVAPARRGGYSVELVDEAGVALPSFPHEGRTWVLGSAGHRYRIRVRNASSRRVEVVVSVDGRDVRDGGPSAVAKPGYLVDPLGEVVIEGYRLGLQSVAAFRFGSVPRSYAALSGDDRDVGVVGVAVFPEREVELPAYLPPASAEARPGPAPSPPPAGAGPATEASRAPARSAGTLADRRAGLGTEFGEERDSPVRLVPFTRARPRPDVVLSLRYDDRPGLLAAGVDLDDRCREASRRREADPFRRDAGFAPPPPGWSPSRTSPIRGCDGAGT
jgi:hypothetical protein